MQLQTGDIVLVDTEGIIPSTIDKFQGNDWNHAGFIVELYGEIYVFEAVPSGMAFTLFEDYVAKRDYGMANLLILRPINYSWDYIDEAKLMNFILPLTDRFYGFDNLFIGQALRYVTKLFGKEMWFGQDKSTKNFICGKLVAYIYNHFFGTFENNWWKLAPADIYNNKEFKHIKYR